jgi:hypothetical protein
MKNKTSNQKGNALLIIIIILAIALAVVLFSKSKTNYSSMSSPTQEPIQISQIWINSRQS